MISDEIRVLIRAGLAGLLFPPLVGALLVALLGALTEPGAADAYLTPWFVAFAFGMAVMFAGPFGLVGAVATATFAIWLARRRYRWTSIRRRLLVLAGLFGATFGWIFTRWILPATDTAWDVVCVGGGAAAGIICAFLSSSILGPPFQRLVSRWSRPAEVTDVE